MHGCGYGRAAEDTSDEDLFYKLGELGEEADSGDGASVQRFTATVKRCTTTCTARVEQHGRDELAQRVGGAGGADPNIVSHPWVLPPHAEHRARAEGRCELHELVPGIPRHRCREPSCTLQSVASRARDLWCAVRAQTERDDGGDVDRRGAMEAQDIALKCWRSGGATLRCVQIEWGLVLADCELSRKYAYMHEWRVFLARPTLAYHLEEVGQYLSKYVQRIYFYAWIPTPAGYVDTRSVNWGYYGSPAHAIVLRGGDGPGGKESETSGTSERVGVGFIESMVIMETLPAVIHNYHLLPLHHHCQFHLSPVQLEPAPRIHKLLLGSATFLGSVALICQRAEVTRPSADLPEKASYYLRRSSRLVLLGSETFLGSVAPICQRAEVTRPSADLPEQVRDFCLHAGKSLVFVKAKQCGVRDIIFLTSMLPAWR
ncbi:hypothetical protein FIBSPDRAFT_887372 [Athelia psychrophila]|uniref:Uncharacterized protein n=1 Tax=Athelia psychrophila TaxID=1759441 RepID=A0A166PNU0_9AGAM|nr:hypothetical protein FIBSPDRAFT_887372 [Fibularhizoctonia sp. CBS 109695]